MSIVESDGPPSWSLDASETGESTKCPWVHVGVVEGKFKTAKLIEHQLFTSDIDIENSLKFLHKLSIFDFAMVGCHGRSQFRSLSYDSP